MDRREDRGGPGGRKKWGRRQAEPAASLESDREGIKSLGEAPSPCEPPPHPQPTPKPEHAAAHTSKGSMFLLCGGPALPLPSTPPPHARFSPPPLISAAPEGLCARGSSLRLLRGLGSPHARGTAWVRKDHRRLKKWVGDGLALFPACCQPQSPTGSRRHVADVREDKGRHGPHQPPVIDGLCPRAHARAAELGDCGGLL